MYRKDGKIGCKITDFLLGSTAGKAVMQGRDWEKHLRLHTWSRQGMPATLQSTTLQLIVTKAQDLVPKLVIRGHGPAGGNKICNYWRMPKKLW